MTFIENPPAPDSADGLGIAYDQGTPSNPQNRTQAQSPFPQGLIGDTAQFFYDAAPRPVVDIAIAGAIGFLAGVTGRAYNVSGTGLNQFLLMLASTGTGKDQISGGNSKLIKAISASSPTIADYKGPGELASSAGLINWLERQPCIFSIVGEFGKMLKLMAAHNAPANLRGLSRTLLQMYSKSGHSEVFDATARSKLEDVTKPIASPSFTLIGETVPEVFYESLDETLIADGLLPRFLTFEYQGQRNYFNKAAKDAVPPPNLVQRLADLVAVCSTIQHTGNAVDVPLNDEAEARFDHFDRWTTDAINEADGEAAKQLWNRAHLKALKLAALQAVGINPHKPVITLGETTWATALVVSQTQALLAKFEEGEVGALAGDEAKQLDALIRVIATYLTEPFDNANRYGGVTYEMHKAGVVSETFLSRRLTKQAPFRLDRMGATFALKRAVKNLLEGDELREMPKAQMAEKFGCHPRSFVVSNPQRFVASYHKGARGEGRQ